MARETVGFLREHLPRKNGRGNILFTTLTEDVAKALTNVAGKRHSIVELRIPDVGDAVELFSKHLSDSETPADTSKVQEIVKMMGCGLGIACASSLDLFISIQVARNAKEQVTNGDDDVDI